MNFSDEMFVPHPLLCVQLVTTSGGLYKDAARLEKVFYVALHMGDLRYVS